MKYNSDLLYRMRQLLMSRNITPMNVIVKGKKIGYTAHFLIYIPCKKSKYVSIDLGLLHYAKGGYSLIFWMPYLGMIRFSPEKILERGIISGKSVKVETKYGSWISSPEDLLRGSVHQSTPKDIVIE